MKERCPFHACNAWRAGNVWQCVPVDTQSMYLTGRKFEDSIMSVIRVQKLSMPGTGGEPAGSPFII